MSVEFTSPAAVQNIDFGTTISGVTGLTTKTICFWAYHDDITTDTTQNYMEFQGGATDESTEIYPILAKIYCVFAFSGGGGAWRTTSDVLTAFAWYHIAISFDGGSTSNNPAIYINGVSKSVTKTSSPSGSYRTGTGANLYLGMGTSGYALDGKLADFRIYNTVLTAAQVLALYNDGPFTPNYDTDLAFHAPLTKSTALSGSAYDGFTLTSSQKLIDRINCVEGTPAGSPFGSDINPT